MKVNKIDYKNEIRFGLTNKCNFNCIFCHNEGMCKEESIHITILPEDYKFISKVSQEDFGINKFILSGGEPLLCNNIIDIAKSIKNLENKVVLITNGFLLENYLELGDIVDEIHVSLGTLNADIHNDRTRTKETLKKVVNSIKEISKRKCKLKINLVMLKSENRKLDNLWKCYCFQKI